MIVPQDLHGGETLRLRPAHLDEFEPLAMLFAALHGYNASFDEKFALATNWKELLYKHMADGVLWLLA